MTDTPIIWWVRRDLRLGDNAALAEAVGMGPVIPVFILDEVFQTYGVAPLWRFALGAQHLNETLKDKGSRLIFRKGPALAVLRDIIDATGACAVRWSRAYDPDQVARDREVKEGLADDGIDAKSLPGHVLFEPWTVETQSGGFYKVFTPYWRNVKDREVAPRRSAPPDIPAPGSWPDSDDPDDWDLAGPMFRGAEILRKHMTIGEDAASTRLATFTRTNIEDYEAARDRIDLHGTSRMSEHLSWGEISPASCWHAGLRAMEDGKSGAETFLKELVWRDFAYHLAWHTPRLVDANWRDEWDAFPWNEDERLAEVKAWKQGRTGMALVDAAMRELWVTGYMHNRARMNVASYLTKHLMCHWRIGQEWFEDCLIDWDPASNALGWQWAAGSGPDAAPFFRVFNPETQAEKHDPDAEYRRRWIAEGQNAPPETACDYFDAIPKRWNMQPTDEYPDPIVSASDGRQKALDAYDAFKD